MRFCSISLDHYRIEARGTYSIRSDQTIVIELEQRLTRSFVEQYINQTIKRIRIHTLNSHELPLVYKGPFRFKERFGVIVFESAEEEKTSSH
ncbi:hypothetical protein EQV77_10690 [Halobacillus fulvus]|nr:hypothetical protein EQV77_10690 [Halobacillus fulvus]